MNLDYSLQTKSSCLKWPSAMEDRTLDLVCFMPEDNFRIGVCCQTEILAVLRLSSVWEAFLRVRRLLAIKVNGSSASLNLILTNSLHCKLITCI